MRTAENLLLLFSFLKFVSTSPQTNSACIVPPTSFPNLIPCRCEQDCHFFNDCCHVGFSSRFSIELFKCVPVPRSEVYGVWLVDSCPSSWPSSEISIRDSCERKNFPVENGRRALNLTITVAAGGRLYENVYCAICHGQRRIEKFVLQCTEASYRKRPNDTAELLESLRKKHCFLVPDVDFSKYPRCGYFRTVESNCTIPPRSINPNRTRNRDVCFKSPTNFYRSSFDYFTVFRNKHCEKCWALKKSSEPETTAVTPKPVKRPTVTTTTVTPTIVTPKPMTNTTVTTTTVTTTTVTTTTVTTTTVTTTRPPGPRPPTRPPGPKPTSGSSLTYYSAEHLLPRLQSIFNGMIYTDGLTNSSSFSSFSYSSNFSSFNSSSTSHSSSSNSSFTSSFSNFSSFNSSFTSHSSSSNSSSSNFSSTIHASLPVAGALGLTCCLLSLLALLLLIAVYMATPGLRNQAGLLIMSVSASLLFAVTTFLLKPVMARWDTACHAVACLTYMAYMSSFAWSSVLTLDLLRTFTSVTGAVQSRDASAADKWRRYARASVVGWLLPLVAGVAALAVDAAAPREWAGRPRFGRDERCYFGSNVALFAWFYCPVALAVLANCVMSALLFRSLWTTAAQTRQVLRRGDRRSTLLLCLKLTFVFGLPWIVGLAAAWSEQDTVRAAAGVVNSLQGVFVSAAFLVTPRVWKRVREVGSSMMTATT